MDRAERIARLCLLATVAAVPLAPLLPVSGAPLAIKQLLVLGLGSLGCVVLLGRALAVRTAPALSTPVDGSLLVFLAVVGASALGAVSLGLSAYGAGLSLALLLMYVLAIQTLRRPAHVRQLYAAVFVSSLVVSGLGLHGYLEFLKDRPDEQLRALYLSTALFPHSYLAAQFLVMVVVGAAVLVLEPGTRRGWRVVTALGLVPMSAYLFVIGSRGAYVAVAAALLLSMLLRGAVASSPAGGRRRTVARLLWRTLLAAGALALVALALQLTGSLGSAAEFAFDRLAMLFDPSRSEFNYSRLDVWKDSLHMVAEHVLLGVGPGNFETSFTAFHAGDKPIPHGHNQFVHVLAESGVAGLAAFLLLLRQARHAAVRGAAHLANDVERRPLFHAAVAALAAGALYFLWETPLLWVEAGGLIVVLLAVMSRAGCTSRDAVPSPVRALSAAALVALCLWATVPAGLDYLAATRLAMESERVELTARSKSDPSVQQAGLLEAAELLAEADERFPHGAGLVGWRARLLTQLGQDDLALATWQLADARAPGSFAALSAQGALHMRNGRPALAIEPLRTAVIAHLGLESAPTYARLAQAYLRSGALEEAWTCYLTLIRHFHFEVVQPSVLLEAARTLVRLKRTPLFADRLLKMYAERVPGSADDPNVQELAADVQILRDAPFRVEHY